MDRKNILKVRLYRTGTIGFEFNCALFRTSEDSEGHVTMYCNFDWEKEDGEGDYDREFGAPDAVKMFLFSVEMNNDEVNRFNFDKPYIKAGQFSKNGVYIKEIENLNIEVNS
jgi:hypothetical protein